MTRRIVSRERWLMARRELLAEEKALTKQRDAVSERRRSMPWVRVEADYAFSTPEGRASLADLFGSCRQLLVYHFMYGPDWSSGCPSCSFWADNFDGIDVHLAHRDISFVVVSRAPLATLEAYKKRMGWRFRWVSAIGDDFNRDVGVYFPKDSTAVGYNYSDRGFPMEDAPGASAFYKDDDGHVYHTYSTYARGLDILNGAYHWMDIAPLGRNEDGLDFSMAWLRRRDEYDSEG